MESAALIEPKPAYAVHRRQPSSSGLRPTNCRYYAVDGGAERNIRKRRAGEMACSIRRARTGTIADSLSTEEL